MPHLVNRLTLSPRGWALAHGHVTVGSAVSGVVVATSPVLRLAVAAYLARSKGRSRVHTESHLRGYLLWCQSRDLGRWAAMRPHIELYVRRLQEARSG